MKALVWYVIGMVSGVWMTTLMAALHLASEDDDRTDRKLREEYENGKQQIV